MFDNGINTGDLFSKYVYVFPCRLFSTLSFRFSFAIHFAFSTPQRHHAQCREIKKRNRTSRYNYAIRVTSNVWRG